MKLKLLIAAIFLAIFSCQSYDQQKEDFYLPFGLKQFTTTPQIAQFHSDSSYTLVGKQGTHIFIPSQSFEYENGTPVNGDIYFQLKEAYSKSEMIFNGLTTMSDRLLLESFGMIHLSATDLKGQEVKLKDDKRIKISFSEVTLSAGPQLFNGNELGTRINWKLASKDTITLTSDVIIPLEYGEDLVIVTKISIVGGDTIFQSESMPEQLSDSAAPSLFLNNDSLIFESSQLGWINCDRFLEVLEKTNLIASTKRIYNADAYLVFKNISSIMPVNLYHEGNLHFDNIPKDEEVTLLVIGKDGATNYFFSQELTTGSVEHIDIDLVKTDLETIRKQIIGLN